MDINKNEIFDEILGNILILSKNTQNSKINNELFKLKKMIRDVENIRNKYIQKNSMEEVKKLNEVLDKINRDLRELVSILTQNKVIEKNSKILGIGAVTAGFAVSQFIIPMFLPLATIGGLISLTGYLSKIYEEFKITKSFDDIESSIQSVTRWNLFGAPWSYRDATN